MTHAYYTPFELGAYAFKHGHGLNSNPFNSLTPEWENWRSGWLFIRSKQLDPDLSI